MRLRNIPRADTVIMECADVIKEEKNHRGKWTQVFGNENPICLEIGMGKGRFLLTLAKQNPHMNYVGIERYSSVLLRAVENFQALKEEGIKLPNVRFICMDATMLPEVFAQEEVNRIYLNFSDPWPKARHARRRLTSKEYFQRYDKVLEKEGCVEFKTDNQDLFTFSMEELAQSSQWEAIEFTVDLHNDEVMRVDNVMTEYEEKFSSLGHPICKLIAKRQLR